MKLIKQLVFLFIASIFVFVEGIIQCSKTNNVNISLDSTVNGGHTRFWQFSEYVGKVVCHEIEKKLKYGTVCAYGNKSKKCQCKGIWTNDQGVNGRISAANKVLSGPLVECVM
jgi:hypothetical protein